MRNKDKWFEFFTAVATRLWFGSPVRKAGFLTLSAGLGILANPVLLLVLLQWAGIIDPDSDPPEIVIGFTLVLLGVLLIISEYIWANRPPPPDQLVLNQLRQKLPREMVDYIRDHQFGNGFYLKQVRGAIELADEWRSAEARFDDSELQDGLKSLVSAAQRFASITRQEMRPIDPGSDFMLIRRPEHGYGHERPYNEVSQDLQTNARQINEAYEAIITRARKLKLKLVAFR